MTVDNPSKATLMKRQQREALAKGEQQPKGRVKQCVLTNLALKKDDPKMELQKLLREKKISVAGLKRCYYDFRIDETALILLNIPFRRKKELKGKAPRAPRAVAPSIAPKLIQRVSEPLDGQDLSGIKKDQKQNVLQLESLAKKTAKDQKDMMEDIAKAKEVAYKVFQQDKKTGFKIRNVFHRHDNLSKKTKEDAEVSNEAVKAQEEERKKKDLAKQEQEILLQQYTTLEKDERERQDEIDAQLLGIARTIDLLDPTNATASRIDAQLNANRKVLEDMRQTGLPTRPSGFVPQTGYNQAPALRTRTIDDTLKEQRLQTQLANYSAYGDRSFEQDVANILLTPEDYDWQTEDEDMSEEELKRIK
jgi:hypothetical protein